MTTTAAGFTAFNRRLNPNGIRGPDLPPRCALTPASSDSAVLSESTTASDDGAHKFPRLEVRPSECRGLGLFTLDAISAYSCLLEDYALLSMATGEDLPQLWPKYSLLPQGDKQTFDALGCSENQLGRESAMAAKLVERGFNSDEAQQMVRVASRFSSNSFKTDSSGRSQWQHALFATVARINHSCTPNAHCHYRKTTGAQYVFALRDIQPGEELEIAYFDITAPLQERLNRSKVWSFQCGCPACSGKLASEYEVRLAGVHKWAERDSQLQFRYRSETIGLPQQIWNAIRIAKSEDFPWLRATLDNLYANYAGALMNNRRHKREVAEALDEALIWTERTTGKPNPQAIEARVAQRKLWRTIKEDGR